MMHNCERLVILLSRLKREANFSNGTATFNSLNYNTALTAGKGFHIGGAGKGNTITVTNSNVVTAAIAQAFAAPANTVNWFTITSSATVIGVADGSNNISGANCNTVWTAIGSPYWVKSNVAIGAGCTLKIEANTVVKFNAGLNIDVNGGVLDVYGTASTPVIFTSVNDDAYGAVITGSTGIPVAGSWAGIKYNSGSAGSTANLF